jgi:Leucine-rich repeat (LRR) protein
MRTYLIIPIVIAALAAVLYFSDRYDREINDYEITTYQCKNSKTIPALEDIFEENKKPIGQNRESYFKKDGNYLGVANTNIEVLPDGIFFDFPCLEYIDLRGNQLKTIPSALKHLPQLIDVDFKYNQLSSLNTNVFSELYQLIKVDFSHNPIQKLTIPMVYNQIHYFGCIRCELNSIDSIYPVSIIKLDLARNDFTMFPIKLFNLNRLEKLDLSRNKIKAVDLENDSPSQFYNTSLTSLDLSLNRLKNFPTSLYKFHNLQELDLKDNQLSGTLTLKGLLYLKALNIPNQNLEKIVISNVSRDRYGSEIFITDFSPSMDSIHLKNNKIEHFIVEADYNESIRIINLSKNKLSYFPSNFHKFKRLESLDLSYNQIESISLDNKFRNKLDILDLSHNQIREITAEFLGDNSSNFFRQVDLSHNRLTLIPSSFLLEAKTTRLNLSNNNIKNMMIMKPISNLDALQVLDLSNNPITSWDTSINNFNYLSELNLSNTYIQDIPLEDLTKMRQLDVIILKNTKIPDNVLQSMKSYLKEYDIEVIF